MGIYYLFMRVQLLCVYSYYDANNHKSIFYTHFEEGLAGFLRDWTSNQNRVLI